MRAFVLFVFHVRRRHEMIHKLAFWVQQSGKTLANDRAVDRKIVRPDISHELQNNDFSHIQPQPQPQLQPQPQPQPQPVPEPQPQPQPLRHPIRVKDVSWSSSR
jgi:hypothetical protein